jgi:hypothetical protein
MNLEVGGREIHHGLTALVADDDIDEDGGCLSLTGARGASRLGRSLRAR